MKNHIAEFLNNLPPEYRAFSDILAKKIEEIEDLKAEIKKNLVLREMYQAMKEALAAYVEENKQLWSKNKRSFQIIDELGAENKQLREDLERALKDVDMFEKLAQK